MFSKKTNIFTAFFLLLVGFGSIAHAQTCAPAQVGLVSWYEGENNALDSRSRNNGSLQNGATFTAGQAGQAFSFDGVDDHITVPHNANQNTGDKITIEGWVNPTSLGSGRTFLQKRSTSNVLGYTFETAGTPSSAENSLNFVIAIGGVFRNATTFVGNQLTIGVWQHVAATYDGEEMRIYLNGVNVALRAQTGAIDAVTDPIVIGRNAVDTSLAWHGGIDEISLYNRALSTQEIAAIHAAGTAGKCKPTATVAPSGLVGWYGGDGNANDISGNGNNGALNGNVLFAVSRVGQGINFGGDLNDFIQIPNSASLSPATITAEAWIKPDVVGFANRIISKDAGAPGCTTPFIVYSLEARGEFGGRATFFYTTSDSILRSVVGTTVIPTNSFSHLAGTFDGTTARIYVNGVLENSQTSPGGVLLTTNEPTIIGNAGAACRAQFGFVAAFDGVIDEPSLYNRALTQAEITSIFNAGIAGKLKQATTPTGFAVSEPGAVATGVFQEGGKVRLGVRETIDETKSLSVSPRPDVPVSQFAPEAVSTTIGDATITFPTVTTAGTTQQIPLAASLLPALPTGTHTGLLYDLATTSVFTGNPTVCFNVPAFTTTQFAGLSVMHLENGNWVNVTAASNTFPTLCTDPVTSFSPFAITQGLAPTSAPASIGGRVVDSLGRGIRNAVVTVQASDGLMRSVRTNTFGRYRIDDLAAGQSYVLSAAAKRYTFANAFRVISLEADLTNENFVADSP